MKPHSYEQVPKFLPSCLAALVLVCLALFVPAAPAAAHDEFLGSDPAPGSTVDAAPAAVELTFSAPPSALGSTVQVVDGAGTEWADGDLRIVDAVATQPLAPGMPDGTYTVQWRVVSSDAHPIEGSFDFSVAAGSTPAATAGAGASATQSAEAKTAAGTETSAAAEEEASGAFPWALGVGAVVLVVIVGVTAFVVRRRLSSGYGPPGQD